MSYRCYYNYYYKHSVNCIIFVENFRSERISSLDLHV